MYISYIYIKIYIDIYIPPQYCLSRVECFLLFCSGLCCIPNAAILPSCSDDGVFIPIQYVRSFARKDLADGMLHSAAAIWYFPRLFSVPPLNAAVTVVTGGEGMRDVPISAASDCPNASAPLQRPLQRTEGQMWAVCYIFW